MSEIYFLGTQQLCLNFEKLFTLQLIIIMMNFVVSIISNIVKPTLICIDLSRL